MVHNEQWVPRENSSSPFVPSTDSSEMHFVRLLGKVRRLCNGHTEQRFYIVRPTFSVSLPVCLSLLLPEVPSYRHHLHMCVGTHMPAHPEWMVWFGTTDDTWEEVREGKRQRRWKMRTEIKLYIKIQNGIYICDLSKYNDFKLRDPLWCRSYTNQTN